MAMNLSVGKLPWYAQVGTFVVLSLIGAGVFWNFYVRPTEAGLDEKRGQLATLRQQVDAGLATARRLPEFRRELTELEAQLERLRPVLPEERDVGDLLRRVQGMATQSNLTIRGFTPRGVTTRQLHAEWPIGLQLEGTYHDLGAFLERVSKFPRIINVDTINIETRENATEAASITVDTTAMTFVLLDPQAVAAAAARGRGGRGARGGRGGRGGGA
jgi:type IV pilus assembly protein PilO